MADLLPRFGASPGLNPGLGIQTCLVRTSSRALHVISLNYRSSAKKKQDYIYAQAHQKACTISCFRSLFVLLKNYYAYHCLSQLSNVIEIHAIFYV
jgi:hypothetical protein